MHTHSVISQRSPNWFYFLVKPTSLHTTSPAPAFAIQMYSQTAGHPGRFIPMMLLFLFFFFFFSCFKVKYFSFGISYALLWSLRERKLLFLALTLENHEGRGTGLSVKWPAGCRKTIKFTQQMGRWLRNYCFPQTMATCQHIDTFESLASWQEKC